jgi:UDP-glucuronate 4-epimerase
MPACYVVTGAAGFIGSHLAAALLSRGHHVVGLDNFDPFYERAVKDANVGRLRGPDFELAETDLRDRDALAKLLRRVRPDAVYHLAALAGVRPSIEDPARYASVNIDGLVSLLDAARGGGCGRIVFASSSSVYGNNRKVPFAETDPVDEPISPYAATKRSGELICHTYSHLFDLAIGCVRLFTVFGPAQRPDLAISTFMRLVARGEPVPMFGDGTTSRDYTYIADIVDGCLAAEARLADEGGGLVRLWNLGGSHPVALRDMIEAIAGVVGRPARIEPRPPQPGDVDRTWADLGRSRAELGYEPKVPFEEGLRRQWVWLKESVGSSSTSCAR